MNSQLINPVDGVYAAAPDYAHAIRLEEARSLVFVSGTMGLDRSGRAPATLAEQLVLVWENLRRILATAGMTLDNVVRVTSYLRDGAFAGPNKDARIAALGGRPVPTTAIVVQTLEEDWLVEIEVIAAA
ncbi:RidA family protein [Stappia indica]|uniref:RidA family protein n=1 Tax=Stappia indica TaxID=538381 RepID=A0A857C7J2_9HYPH|nr:RidA family protein [Stappia indica]QGZ34996.1 RidA family protein [Stappia indica]